MEYKHIARLLLTYFNLTGHADTSVFIQTTEWTP